MRYTNKHNFPDYVVLWLESDDYDYEANVLSATTLLKPARQFALYKFHASDLECDVSDVIASRYGTALHASFEYCKMPHTLKEKRFYVTLLGQKVSGKSDLITDTHLPTQKLVDIKSTSVWNYIYSSNDLSYVNQLSVYRYLANNNGLNVGKAAEIFMMFTDWSSKKSREDCSYPPTRIAIKPIQLLSLASTKSFIEERITLLNSTLTSPDSLPACTREDLWMQPDKFELWLPNRKYPSKVSGTYTEAESFAKSKNFFNYQVKLRKGIARRCDYCLARRFCSQYKQLLKDGAANSDSTQNL